MTFCLELELLMEWETFYLELELLMEWGTQFAEYEKILGKGAAQGGMLPNSFFFSEKISTYVWSYCMHEISRNRRLRAYTSYPLLTSNE